MNRANLVTRHIAISYHLDRRQVARTESDANSDDSRDVELELLAGLVRNEALD